MSTKLLAFTLVSIWLIVTVSVPAVLLWTPYTSPSREGTLLASFEKDLEQWHSNSIQWTNEDSRQGRASLKVIWENGEENTVFAPKLDREMCIDFLICEINVSKAVPACASRSLKPILFFKNKDGDWYQAIGHPLVPGNWMLYKFDISSTSLDLQPVHQGGAWNGQASRECDIWGFSFASSALSYAEILIDNVRFVGQKIEGSYVYGLVPGPEVVNSYELFESSFEVCPEPSNPFDPDVADVWGVFEEPNGNTKRVPAFYYRPYKRVLRGGVEEIIPEGSAEWRVRFTPVISGIHTWNISGKVEGKSISAGPFSFNVVKKDSPGFVRIKKKSRYFSMDNGDFFYPIGHNFRSPTDTRTARLLKEPTPLDSGTFKYDEVLPKMAKCGENTFELWMASWFAEIEWIEDWKNYHGLGMYNLANAWKLDYVIEKARELNLKIHLVIDNHGQISNWCDDEWKYSPYNSLNHGGLVFNPDDFWTNKEAISQYKKKIRYIAARWGFSPTIMGFELISELDLTGSGYENYMHPRVLRWHRHISKTLRSYDVNNHIITTHFSTDYKKILPTFVVDSCIDYLVGDAYRQEGDIVNLLRQTDRRLGYSSPAKPYFITEFGGTPLGNSLDSLHADLHCGLWSSYMTNAAASPFFWWFELIDREDWYYHFKALSEFNKDEDRTGKKFTPLRVKTTSLKASAQAIFSKAQGYGWVYSNEILDSISEKRPSVISGAIAYFENVPAGTYQYEIWDTFKGEIVLKDTIDSTPINRRTYHKLGIPLPDFRYDFAIKFRLTQ